MLCCPSLSAGGARWCRTARNLSGERAAAHPPTGFLLHAVGIDVDVVDLPGARALGREGEADLTVHLAAQRAAGAQHERLAGGPGGTRTDVAERHRAHAAVAAGGPADAPGSSR